MRRASGPSIAVLLAAAVTAAACLSRTPPESSPPPPAAQVAPAPAPPPPAEPAEPDPNLKLLEQRTKDLELQLLVKESENQDLRERVASQQRLLDDSIQEVVRAKAKLLSLESRAEAASQMAETEIALKALEGQPQADQDPDLPQIRQLLTMSSKEFEKENFGGALYLTIQAKGRIQEAEMRRRVREKVALGRDENSFPSPLALKVTKSSNLRDQPNLGSRVLATLGAGTPVTGISHKGEWVRVVCDDGSRGWIRQELLSSR